MNLTDTTLLHDALYILTLGVAGGLLTGLAAWGVHAGLSVLGVVFDISNI